MMSGVSIRKATESDMEQIMRIFEHARRFMAAAGNPNQWTDGYPGRDVVLRDIALGHCRVFTEADCRVVGTFTVIPGPDPTYARIYDGAWPDDRPYHVIHRLASDGSVKGLGRLCLEWCAERFGNLRIDTHEDNLIMQSLAVQCGFVRCGIIHVANGTPRIAYQLAEG